MLPGETIDFLERQALSQRGKEIGTGVVVTPGQLLELIRVYRAGTTPVETTQETPAPAVPQPPAQND